MKELEFKIEWENNVSFSMIKRIDGGPWIKVVEIEENTHIAAIVGSLKGLCMADFDAHLNDIMAEMQT